ncbi:MAG: response regulator transcription factor [Hyphomonadaceae bacterium]
MRGAACVIEPDDDAREHLAGALRAMGYTTHESSAGAVGMFIAEQVSLRAAVVNVMLPDVKGLKLVRRLRSRSPDALIIALTPEARTGVAFLLARIAGADAVLSAPPSCEALTAALNEAEPLHRHPPPIQQQHAEG